MQASKRRQGELASKGRERDAMSAVFATELKSIDAELWHERRAVQGLWSSRRILVDEVQSLRQRLREKDATVQQQAARIAILERDLQQRDHAVLAARDLARHGRLQVQLSEQEALNHVTQTPTASYHSGLRTPAVTPAARASVLESRIETELANTRAELEALLGAASSRASSAASRNPASGRWEPADAW